jgi:hypothetical protein
MTMPERQACKSARSLPCCSASRNSTRPNIKLSAQIVREPSSFGTDNRLLISPIAVAQRLASPRQSSVASSAAIKSP